MREIKEEVGNKAQFQIDDFIGAFNSKKLDKRINQDINWLFLVYDGKYLGGDLKINEPGKCLGYEFYKKSELPSQKLSSGCVFLKDYYHNIYLKDKEM